MLAVMKKLYFMRHGLSTANKRTIVSGRSNHWLSPEGREQAKLAGQKAKGLHIDLIVCSTQTRALQTAKIFAKEIGYPVKKIVVNSLLVERDFGDYEGTRGLITDKVMEAIYEYGDGGSESDKAILKRAEEAFNWISSLGAKSILVVSHGSFGRALRKVAKTEHDYEERIANAELACWIGEE